MQAGKRAEIFEAEGGRPRLLVYLRGLRLRARHRFARDLGLASYGVVNMVPGGPGSGYQDLGWEPKPRSGAGQAG